MATRPPPIWHHLTPERQQQLAQVVADLLRRMRHPQQMEGSSDDTHPER